MWWYGSCVMGAVCVMRVGVDDIIAVFPGTFRFALFSARVQLLR